MFELVEHGCDYLVQPPDREEQILSETVSIAQRMVVELQCPHLPKAGVLLDRYIDKAALAQEVFEAVPGVPEIVVRIFVDMPHEGNRYQQLAFWFQNPEALGQKEIRFLQMLH